MCIRDRAGAVSNQHHVLESSIRSQFDPGGEILHFLTGHSPITTAADSLVSSPSQHVPKVVHACVAADACVAALCEPSANRYICRRVKIHSPSVNPNDCDGFGSVSY